MKRAPHRVCGRYAELQSCLGDDEPSQLEFGMPLNQTTSAQRAALYARYSSDLQCETSTDDQLRVCAQRAAKEGWRVVESYTDQGISGASLIRSGIQRLLQDAAAGKLDLILTESLDRMSRDQEDIAHVYKRMQFLGVKIVTLSEGEVNELHIGLKGTMGALYLKDLADKTRHGLRGRIEAGKSGGGNSYGYDVVKKFDDNPTLEGPGDAPTVDLGALH